VSSLRISFSSATGLIYHMSVGGLIITSFLLSSCHVAINGVDSFLDCLLSNGWSSSKSVVVGRKKTRHDTGDTGIGFDLLGGLVAFALEACLMTFEVGPRC